MALSYSVTGSGRRRGGGGGRSGPGRIAPRPRANRRTGCQRADAHSPATSTSDDEQLIRAWIDAVNDRDFDAAAELMARRVETGATPIEGSSAIRAALEQLHPCVLMVESIEKSGASFLVNVQFESSAARDCPADVAATEGTFVLELADGHITRIP